MIKNIPERTGKIASTEIDLAGKLRRVSAPPGQRKQHDGCINGVSRHTHDDQRTMAENILSAVTFQLPHSRNRRDRGDGSVEPVQQGLFAAIK